MCAVKPRQMTVIQQVQRAQRHLDGGGGAPRLERRRAAPARAAHARGEPPPAHPAAHRARAHRSRPRGGAPASRTAAPLRRERWFVALLLAGFTAFAVWGAARNSVTFDENFHLPSGVAIVDRGDFAVSPFQPPLVKVLCALAANAAGARPPADSTIATHVQLAVGESFMRVNAVRYQAVFFAARLPVIGLGVLLGLLVWRWSRRLWGARAALLSLALYVSAPETLAHAGLVGMDLPTGLAFVATLYAFWRFSRTARWRDAAWLALAVGLALITRFSALLLPPLLVLLAAIATLRGQRVARGASGSSSR
jgi:hypothetical protein